MPSIASARFSENKTDVERLLALHAAIAGDTRGRKWGVEMLNKSAVVLICAFWEAFIEDLADEGLDSIAARISDFNKLPLDLRKHLAKAVKSNPHDLSPWDMAADGWKALLRSNLADVKKKLWGNWNTPKSPNIRDLYFQALGIPDVTASWQREWMSSAKAVKKLDEFVTLRGAVAHRGNAAQSVTKKNANDFLSLVGELVGFTDDAVNQHVRSITGSPLF